VLALRESTPDASTAAATATPSLGAIDALLFSGLWVAAAAAALTAASFHALAAAPQPEIVALAFLGTLAVYAVDRLRDLERDGAPAPLRSAFVVRHRRTLQALSIASAAAAGLCALRAGPRAIAIAAGVLVVGLFHRRLKRWSLLQPIYVVCAWLAVTLGLPLATAPGAAHAGWIAAVLAPALFANVAAPHASGASRGFAALGVVLAIFAPAPVRPLGAIAVATGLALLGFRASERYVLGVLDGALLAGALVSLAL
jgi:hypothetical protein